MTNPTLRTINETAAILGCCRATIYHHFWRRELDAVKHGKFRLVSESSIKRLLAQRAAAF